MAQIVAWGLGFRVWGLGFKGLLFWGLGAAGFSVWGFRGVSVFLRVGLPYASKHKLGLQAQGTLGLL